MQKTAYLIKVSAFYYAITGLVCLFFPEEILLKIHSNTEEELILFSQLFGAAILSFAYLNWFFRNSLIGGIYGRPISITNLTFNLITGLILLNFSFRNQELLCIIPMVIHLLLAVFFGLISRKTPEKVRKND